MDKKKINEFIVIGKALSRVNANNSHSGNLSMQDGDDRFYITATGSQLGDLAPRDLVPLKFSGVSAGDSRASTESTIHRQVLAMPGVNACIHCHYINATALTFDSAEKQTFLRYQGKDEHQLDKFLLQPVDAFGVKFLGNLEVETFKQPVGSKEMDERIPQCLARVPLTLVRGHGPFIRGISLRDCLFKASVMENSAIILLTLRRYGLDLSGIQDRLIAGEELFSLDLPEPDLEAGRIETKDPTVINDFRTWLNYNFNNYLGAYGAGSMSQKINAAQMLYSPMGAAPEDLSFSLLRLDIEPSPEDNVQLAFHKLLYRESNFNTCMISPAPLATAEGIVGLGLSALEGKPLGLKYESQDHPVIPPIDAEAIYLNPRLGLTDLSTLGMLTADNPIINQLRWHKGTCVVSGLGVVAAGETTLEQAAHNIASAERIARYRLEAWINEKLLDGVPLKDFEPKTI